MKYNVQLQVEPQKFLSLKSSLTRLSEMEDRKLFRKLSGVLSASIDWKQKLLVLKIKHTKNLSFLWSMLLLNEWWNFNSNQRLDGWDRKKEYVTFFVTPPYPPPFLNTYYLLQILHLWARITILGTICFFIFRFGKKRCNKTGSGPPLPFSWNRFHFLWLGP